MKFNSRNSTHNSVIFYVARVESFSPDFIENQISPNSLHTSPGKAEKREEIYKQDAMAKISYFLDVN